MNVQYITLGLCTWHWPLLLPGFVAGFRNLCVSFNETVSLLKKRFTKTLEICFT